MNDRDLALVVMQHALAQGAEIAEVAVVSSTTTDIGVVNLTPETVTVRNAIGFGVRVLWEHRLGFAASNRLDIADAGKVVEALMSVTRQHSPDEANDIPESTVSGPWQDSLVTYDEEIARVPLERKVERALSLERSLRAIDQRICGASTVRYVDGAEVETLVNSRGVDGFSRSTFAYGVLEAIAGDGDGGVETGIEVGASNTYSGLDIGAIARVAGFRALRMLGSKPAKSAELPLIIPPEVGGDILAYISRMVNADAVQKGKSLFRGRENTAVAAPMVSLVDDGRHEGGLATRFADAEGIPTERTSVIENGILRNLLHDAYTAKKGGTRSTGNSSRSGYSGAPHIATTNFMLLPTNAPAATLFEGVAAGLYVTETQGLHAAINPVSGDFSIPSKGIMIRNGELAEPVTELAISGNLFSLLHDIDGIGDDFTWSLAGSYVGTPTFRVKNVKIGSAD